MTTTLSSSSSVSSADHITLTTKRHTLDKETELRIEVGENNPAYIKLVNGTAELFGVELAEGRQYTLYPGRKVCIFTWYGAEIVTSGNITTEYTSNDTVIPLYANLHQRLEGKREEARVSGQQGPRVLLVGPVDSGKSTLSRTLCSYAARVGRAPTFIDLDLGQGEISIPGTIAATPLDKLCLSIEEGYTQVTPLVYYYGHLSAHDTTPVYLNYIQRLSDTVHRRTLHDDIARTSGMIINTMGWIEGGGYPLLLDIIRYFQIDVIVVLGQDRLFAQLSEEIKTIQYQINVHSSSTVSTGSNNTIPGIIIGDSGSTTDASSSISSSSSSTANQLPSTRTYVASPPTKPLSIIKLTRSGGIVIRDQGTRRLARKIRFKEYFYGPDRGIGVPAVLSPEIMTVKFEDVVLVRVGGVTSDSTLVPIGKTSALDPLRTTIVVPTLSLLNAVLGVSFATNEKQIPYVNVAGFVHVRAVSIDQRTLTLLIPNGGTLPSKYLIVGSNTWIE